MAHKEIEQSAIYKDKLSEVDIRQARIQGVAEGAGAPPWRLTVTTSLFS